MIKQIDISIKTTLMKKLEKHKTITVATMVALGIPQKIMNNWLNNVSGGADEFTPKNFLNSYEEFEDLKNSLKKGTRMKCTLEHNKVYVDNVDLTITIFNKNKKLLTLNQTIYPDGKIINLYKIIH